MSYTCIKKLSLSGNRYYPGDIIPDDAFLEGSAAKLIKAKYVAESNDSLAAASASLPEDEPVIAVVFADGDSSSAYPVNSEQLQAIADTMSKTSADASAAVREISDESVLAFIRYVDSRKAVREAAEKRLASLYEDMGQPDPGESGAAQEATEGNPGQTTAPAAQ